MVMVRGHGQGSGSWGGVEASQRHRITQGSGDQRIVPPSKRFLCVFSRLKSPSISSLALNLSSKVSLLLFALFCYKSFLLQQCVLPVSPGYGLLENQDVLSD